MGRRGPVPREARVGNTDARLQCPKHLGQSEKTVWKTIVPGLRESGVLLELDSAVVESFCVHFVSWRKYNQALLKLRISGTEHRRVQSMVASAHGQWLKAAAELGMSPNARARMRLESTEAGQDELDEFVKAKP